MRKNTSELEFTMICDKQVGRMDSKMANARGGLDLTFFNMLRFGTGAFHFNQRKSRRVTSPACISQGGKISRTCVA